MTDQDRLSQLVPGAVSAAATGRKDLVEIAGAIGCGDTDGFIDATAKLCALQWSSGVPREPGWLELHSDEWSIDFSLPHNRASLFQAVIAAMLVRAGLYDLTVSWLAKVLPAVVDLEAAAVRRDADGVLVHLRFTPGEMPAVLRDTVNALDFADLQDALASVADTGKALHVGTWAKVTVGR